MANKTFYVIDLSNNIVKTSHPTREMCQLHIDNANGLFKAYAKHGAEIVEGSAALKARLKELNAEGLG